MSISDDKVLISLVISKEDKKMLEKIASRQDCSVSSLIRKGVKLIVNEYSSLVDSKSFIKVTDDSDNLLEFNTSKDEFLDNILNSVLYLESED